ncbi:hypothetical protein [Lactobacillus intestinalis]|uniref:hypothetical protein n=1 Tax=Lactobacillus intestinalis TaxID=151781 RepID=UPI00210626C5|nr:hypothetical protein [Lactobacillus intestinalis]UTW41094.1 hypothetical protein KBW87_08180 [Lactobacillus intestinalis]
MQRAMMRPLKAADEGVKEINSINIPSLDSALEKALNAIQDALTNKLDEINKATIYHKVKEMN